MQYLGRGPQIGEMNSRVVLDRHMTSTVRLFSLPLVLSERSFCFAWIATNMTELQFITVIGTLLHEEGGKRPKTSSPIRNTHCVVIAPFFSVFSRDHRV